MAVRVLIILGVFSSLVAGCRSYLLLRPGETVVQHYHNPERVLLLVSGSGPRDSLWRSQYCVIDTVGSEILTVSVGDSMTLLRKLNILADSQFVVQEGDTLYDVVRLNAAIQFDQPDCGCFYLVHPIEGEPSRRVYQSTRCIDLYASRGVICKIKVYIWMT